MTDNNIAKIINEISSGRNNVAKGQGKGEIEFEIGSRPELPEKEKVAEDEIAETVVSDGESESNEESVPNIFDLAEREDNSEPVNEGVYRFRATYIPRFTDMDAPVEKNNPPQASVVINATDAPELDPTAEIDKDTKTEVISVNVDRDSDLIDESARVFKFSDPDEERGVQHVEVEEANESIPEPQSEPVPEPIVEEAPKPAPVEKKEAVPPKKFEKYVPTEVSQVEQIRNVGSVIHDDGNKKEFKTLEKREYFKDRFLDVLLSIKVRFSVVVFLSVVLCVFENLGVFGVDIVKIFKLEATPAALAIIDIQLSLCLFLLSLPELYVALKQLSEKKIVSDIIIVPAFIVYFVYTVTLINKAPGKTVLVGFIYSIFVLSVISSSYFRNSADFIAFKMISKPDEKMIVDNKYTRTLERENMALDGVVEEYKSRTARVFKTSFVADFMSRISRSAEAVKHLLLILFLPLGVALVVSVVVFFIYDKSFINSLTAFTVVYLFSIPAFSILTHKLPFYHAMREALSEGGAFIGESSVHSYAGIDVICFEDTEIFDAEDVNIQRIMLYGNNENLTKALRQMSALFMNVGGPLDIIFSNSLDKKCDPANGVLIKENGISGEMDGMKIMAGSYEYMLSEGAEIPDDGEDVASSIGSTKTMYAAENGVVYAKFLIRYRFSEEFTMLLPSLREEKIVPLVYTRDPNVSAELFKTLTAGTNDIRILKKNTIPNLGFAPSKISAGMVIEGEKESLVNLVLLAKRYARLNATAKITERSSMVAAIAIGTLLALGDMISPITLPILGFWQIGWCIALHILSKKTFKYPKDNNKNAK